MHFRLRNEWLSSSYLQPLFAISLDSSSRMIGREHGNEMLCCCRYCSRPETSKPASASGGGTGSGAATIKSFEVSGDKMKRKELLFKDITKLPVLNAPSLWYDMSI